MIRILALLFSLLLILSGCQGTSKESDYDYSNAAVSNDPLVICVDLESFNSEGGNPSRDQAMRDLLYTLEHTGGLTDVAIEFIPPSGTERKTYIDRLRVEIMAGEGPDVF